MGEVPHMHDGVLRVVRDVGKWTFLSMWALHTHTHTFPIIVSKVKWVPWSSGTHSLMSGVSEYSIVNLKRKARDPHMHTLPRLSPQSPPITSPLTLRSSLECRTSRCTSLSTRTYLNLRHYGSNNSNPSSS